MSVEAEQRDLLFAAIKKVATDRRTPGWILDVLSKAAMDAKNLARKLPDSLDTNDVSSTKSLEPGVLARNIDSKDSCLYKVLDISTEIQGIKLFTVQIIEGNDKNPAGMIIHNVPETKLKAV